MIKVIPALLASHYLVAIAIIILVGSTLSILAYKWARKNNFAEPMGPTVVTALISGFIGLIVCFSISSMDRHGRADDYIEQLSASTGATFTYDEVDRLNLTSAEVGDSEKVLTSGAVSVVFVYDGRPQVANLIAVADKGEINLFQLGDSQELKKFNPPSIAESNR